MTLKVMTAGGVTAAAAAMLCSSCAPLGPVPSHSSVVVAVPDPDRRLLQRLDLGRSLAENDPVVPAAASPEGAAPPFVSAGAGAGAGRAQQCLSAAVYYEARSEAVDGQRAVAQVVLNRVRDRAFPASVCGVVYQRSSRGCQFSFACDGSTARAIEPAAWRRAEEVAGAALAGSVYAPVGAATHYHAAYVSPWWAPSLDRIGAVGSHIFYRWRPRLAGALSFRQLYTGEEPAPAPIAPTVAASGSGVSTEAGVAVHRMGTVAAVEADAPAASVAGVRSFGVRVHHGDAGSAFGVSIRTGAAGSAAEELAPTS